MEPTRFATISSKTKRTSWKLKQILQLQYLLGNGSKKDLIMSRPPIRWLLVEWNTGELEVISVKSVVKTSLKLSDLTTGKLITVAVGTQQVPAKIVMSSDDRNFLQHQIHPMTIHKKEPTESTVEVYPKIYDDAEQIKSPAKDFSPSASSWTAEEWDTSSRSSSEEEIVVKNIKKEKVKRKYTRQERSAKLPTPSLKLQPVIPNNIKLNGSTSVFDQSNILPEHMFISQINMTESSLTMGQSTRRRMMYDQQVQTDDVVLPTREEIKNLQQELQSCQEIIHSTKEALLKISPILNTVHVLNALTGNISKSVVNLNSQINEINGHKNPPKESTTIVETLRDSTNNNSKKRTKKRKSEFIVTNGVKVEKKSPPKILNGSLNNSISKPKLSLINNSGIDQLDVTNNQGNVTIGTPVAIERDEMVPIGSGKTLIPKRLYDEINWSSYTMATRKLLMAVFPRNVLGTHSLTGKSSPAFMNRPPKLCLDPRKVSDIVLTVTKLCNVKENLVRSAITIKCADENKMMKFQHIKLAASAKKAKRRIRESRTSNDESDSD